jgi:hypothetical protein
MLSLIPQKQQIDQKEEMLASIDIHSVFFHTQLKKKILH